MANKTIKYQIAKNQDRAVVLWEHVDSVGIKRLEAAIVAVDSPVENLHHIQAAFDAHFGAGRGHSQIIIKDSYTIMIDNDPQAKNGV